MVPAIDARIKLGNHIYAYLDTIQSRVVNVMIQRTVCKSGQLLCQSIEYPLKRSLIVFPVPAFVLFSIYFQGRFNIILRGLGLECNKTFEIVSCLIFRFMLHRQD